VLNRESDTPTAVQMIKDGESILTPSPHLAMMVLLSLGVPVDEALEKIQRANSVLDDPFPIDF
jgi:hypothetical protein